MVKRPRGFDQAKAIPQAEAVTLIFDSWKN